MNGDPRDFWDYFELALQVCTLLLGIIGIWGVVYSLRRNREQERVAAGPYVRVDIGPTEGIEDQASLNVYYEDVTQFVDLSEGSDGTLEVSSWFRNYQTGALGFALGVTASFLVEISHPLNRQDTRSEQIEAEIPYVENGKCVRVALALLPADFDLSVTLLSVSFYDLYDHLHEHAYGRKGSNAMHGRLVWQRTAEFDESTPEGRSRGRGLDYNVGALRKDWE